MTILAQISDTHLIDAELGNDRAPKRIEWLRRCVQDINGLDPRPDAVIHTGDMTQHASHAEYVLAREILAKLKMPLYVTPGNRDSRTELREVFSEDGCFPSDSEFLHYSVNIGAIRLVAIDSVCEGSRMGDLCDDRLAAIDETLGAAPDTPTALFMHHPPFEVLTSDQPLQFGSREVVDKLARIMHRHAQVTRVFCGHSHRCFVSDVANARASTLPSIAVDLRLGNYPETVSDTPIYQMHRFHPDSGFCSETRLVM